MGIPPTAEVQTDEAKLRIGLLNLMPAASLERTLSDFGKLIIASGVPADLRPYKFQDDPRDSNPSSQSREVIAGYTPYIIGQTALDGLIITGANHELTDDAKSLLPYDSIDYYKQLQAVMHDADKRVTSTFYSCLAAHIALHRFFNLERDELGSKPQKYLGVYAHTNLQPTHIFTRGLDAEITAPHSRWGNVSTAKLHDVEGIQVLAENDTAGWLLAARVNLSGAYDLLAQGHPEYPVEALHDEYVRDLKVGVGQMPENYYPNNDVASEKVAPDWHGQGIMLMRNWLEHIQTMRPAVTVGPK